ncbi:MAG: zf-HC2 domain-containing protein [Xenococcaceae cyanobacterium MO_188.B32]|nr:zf-HC2 domain-containing protein [Xenococcaceae cyanobacterium MO_188.B32]
MTSNYDDFNLNPKSDQVKEDFIDPQQGIFDLDGNEMSDPKLECFELLSAYLDNEVSVEERRQVQYWLDNNPEIKKLYLQLSRLNQGVQNIPTPQETISTKQLSERVFQSIDRTQRKRKVSIWGGAIAALALATVSNLFTGSGNIPALKLAESSEQETVSQPIMVAVAVNKPAVKIPKAAVSSVHRQLPENNP